MRPLNLRLEAFGSYAGVFEVDFARLGRHGVFSITGPTGAGKSTIFDAIVYALYDDLPGFRTDSHVRSQFADETALTTVSLTFEAEGAEWVVERAPSRTRPRQRGDGAPVVDKSRVVLRKLGAEGKAITRKSAAAVEILRLVGLTKAQFEQVVLIPQGRFEEVLKADTKDRATLLAHLFPVDVFRRTTDALKAAAASHRESFEALCAGSTVLTEQIRTDLVDAYAQDPDHSDAGPDRIALSVGEELDAAAIGEHRVRLGRLADELTAACETARSAADAARVRRVAAEEMATRWDQWRSDRDAAAGFPAQEAADRSEREFLDRSRKVSVLAPARDKWRTATDVLARWTVERTRYETLLDREWDAGYDRGMLASAGRAATLVVTVTHDADALATADSQHADLSRRRTGLDAGTADLDHRDAASAATESALITADTCITETRTRLEKALAGASGRETAEVHVDELVATLGVATARKEADAIVATCARDADRAVTEVAATAERLDAIRRAWRSGVAGRLAGHLVDGEPCPTCGSPDHPAPAGTDGGAPGDDELQEAEAALHRHQESRRECDIALVRATATAAAMAEVGDPDVLRSSLDIARVELDAAEAAGREAVRLTGTVEELVAKRDAGRAAAVEERMQLREARATHRAACDQWERERSAFVKTHGTFAGMADSAAARQRLAAALGDFAAALRRSEDAATSLGESRDMLEPTLAEFGVDGPADLERWARPDDENNRAAAELDRRADGRRLVAERITRFEADGGPADRPDPEPLAAAERDANARVDGLIGRSAVVTSRLASIDAARTALAETVGVLDGARRRKEEAETLAAACAGLGSGPVGKHVSLENWVLAYYLGHVLAQANVRLDAMTAGRYALELDRESTDGRRSWGLDLSVLDADTGQSRPATTLSGGETFMAALSLALGLADVVSAGSNYSIGALFVDEGFGSLDGESLDTVVDVLRSLQDGGRMVGVISHVQDLQDALPTGITVEATGHGSRAKVHYPDR